MSSTGRMTSSSTSARSCSVDTVGECWVESTTVSMVARHLAVVPDRDLGLAVGAQVVELALLAHLGEPLGEPVREPDRHGHELGRLAVA